MKTWTPDQVGGDEFMRVPGDSPAGISKASSLESHDFLGLLTQTVNAQTHHVATLQEHGRWFAVNLDAHPHARWRAGGDDVARPKIMVLVLPV